MNSLQSKGWDDFLTLFERAGSKAVLNELCGLLFTLEEKEQLSLRVELVNELLKGEKTQREISRDLNISIAKITRGSNALKTSSESLKKFIKESVELKGFFIAWVSNFILSYALARKKKLLPLRSIV